MPPNDPLVEGQPSLHRWHRYDSEPSDEPPHSYCPGPGTTYLLISIHNLRLPSVDRRPLRLLAEQSSPA